MSDNASFRMSLPCLQGLASPKEGFVKSAASQQRAAAAVQARKRPEALTPRESQILELIWSGLKNREIAHRLKISVKTVEAHRATIMKKVRVSNTAQLLKAAIQDRLIKA